MAPTLSDSSKSARWSALLPLLIGTLVVAGLLAGLGALLELPHRGQGGSRATLAISTSGDHELLRNIVSFWQAKAAPKLVTAFLLCDTFLFIPLYVATLLRLRAALQASHPNAIGHLAMGRLWRWLLGALVAADLAENALIASVVFLADAGSQPLHLLLRAAGLSKWLLTVLVLSITAVACLAQIPMSGWGNRLFRLLETVRDIGLYLWTYFLPLAMVALGVGVLGSVPQTREVLQGMRGHAPDNEGAFVFSLLAIVAWLTCCTQAFKLLDGLRTGDAGSAAPVDRLRARHQLLLAVASLLSTTQLLVIFIPNSTPLTLAMIASGGFTVWVCLTAFLERTVQVWDLPTNKFTRVVRIRTIAWVYALFIAVLAASYWLPIPDDWVLNGLGFYMKQDRLWRFNPDLIRLQLLAPPALAVAGTALVFWSFSRDACLGNAMSNFGAGAASGGALLVLGSIAFALGWNTAGIQFVLIATLASAVWVLSRRAQPAEYKARWIRWETIAKSKIRERFPSVSEWLLKHTSWVLRRGLISQLNGPRNIFFMLLLLAFIAGNFGAPSLAVQVGTLTIVYLGVAAWGLATTWLFVYVPKKHGLGNWMLAPLFWAVIASPTAKLTEERAKEADPINTHATGLPTLHEHFELWRNGLPDREKSPIFVVAAAGGGLRAAYWTALLLAEMDDRTCGQFGRHVMAASGVSGGSVGLALYAAQRRIWERKPLPSRCIPNRAAEMRAVLRNDYLSPVVASAIFGDLPQSLVPYRYRSKDRNDALSTAFKDLWAKTYPGESNVLAEPMAQALPGMRFLPGSGTESEGNAGQPVVLFNSTGVETGRRVIASNVALLNVTADRLLQESEVFAGNRLLTANVSLIDAALDSARFPGVSPAGTVWGCASDFGAEAKESCDQEPMAIGRGPLVHVVDGGLFENSGIETAQDFLSELLSHGSVSSHKNVPPIYLIAISNDKNTHRLCSGDGDPTPRLMSFGPSREDVDLLKAINGFPHTRRPDDRTYSSYDGPLTAASALLSVRDSRARLELRRAIGEFGCPNVIEWSLGDYLTNVPEPALGWMLSSTSFDLMDKAVQDYGEALPFDQAACPARDVAPRGLVGGKDDLAKRCMAAPPKRVRAPITPDSIRAELKSVD